MVNNSVILYKVDFLCKPWNGGNKTFLPHFHSICTRMNTLTHYQ